MKVSELRLKNIKCFKDIKIPFEDEKGNSKNCSLIVGNNGEGKTTILRSLALSLCDEEEVGGLLLDLHGSFLKEGAESGEIEVTLKDSSDKKYTIQTTIQKDGKVAKETKPEGNTEKIFAVGYGSSRAIIGNIEGSSEYNLADSLYSLFNYEYGLQNPELVARRIKDFDRDEWDKCEKLLKEILMLSSSDKIVFERNGFYVDCANQGKIPFTALSDGYQSVSSLIFDFLSWKLLDEENFDVENLSGIFIIDEIEQHLHPKWQRQILKILSEQLPNMQFVCSSHAPICAVGLNDLDCPSQLVKTAYVNGHSEVDIFDLKEDFKGYRVDQILTSEVFGLSDARSLTIEKKLEKYRDIYIKEESDRSDQEKKDLKKIKDELKDLPMWEDELDKQTRQELITLIKEKNKGN